VPPGWICTATRTGRVMNAPESGRGRLLSQVHRAPSLFRVGTPTGHRVIVLQMSYTVAMADTITFRPDEDTWKALEVLTKDGTAVSAAARFALIDAACRKAGAAIRAEAESLAERNRLERLGSGG
jgi:hypothetical protein